MYIYQIGALTYYHRRNEIYKGLEWRNQLDQWAEDNNVKCFNPAITFLKEKNHTYDEQMCVIQNEYYINKCDIAVVNMVDIDFSPGSIYELVAFKKAHKPVIAFGERHWSPHINSCISNYCETLDDVIELLCNEFNQNSFN